MFLPISYIHVMFYRKIFKCTIGTCVCVVVLGSGGVGATTTITRLGHYPNKQSGPARFQLAK